MHKDIKYLAEQSGFDIASTEGQYNGHIFRNQLEVFARKIVQEAVSVCVSTEDRRRIREHFGIVNCLDHRPVTY